MEEGKRPLSHTQLKELSAKAKAANQQKYLENSRKRLDKIMCTKIRTSFIGSLDAFEQVFGFLWGHGKKEEDKTEEEKQMFQLWAQARTEVLNNGNNQLRGARNEIANHTVSWNRYHMDLPVKPREEENEDGKE